MREYSDGDGGGGSQCGYGVRPVGRMGSSNDRDFTIKNVSISGAPEDAAWLVVESDAGWRIVDDVVGGFGFVHWDDVYGHPAHATMYDHNLDEVWADSVVF